MDDQHTRRNLLRASAGVVGAGLLAGCTGSQSDTDQRIAELEDRIEQLEAENERLREQEAETSSSDDSSSSGQFATSGSEFSDDVRSQAESVGDTAREGVVFLTMDHGSGRHSSGTGWFYDSNHILTNAHVVRGDADLSAYTFHGDEIDVSLVDATDPREDMLDVALLETSAEPPTTLSTATSESLSPDQPVIQIGHPMFIGYWTVSLGAFKKRDYEGNLNTEIPQSQGNSGGPLLTLDGNVVGMTWGSRPVEQLRRPDTAPEPTDVGVYEQYPYQQQIHAFQNPAEAIDQKVQSWLG